MIKGQKYSPPPESSPSKGREMPDRIGSGLQGGNPMATLQTIKIKFFLKLPEQDHGDFAGWR